MPDAAKVEKATVEDVVSDLLLIMPLIRKKLLNLDDIKQKSGLPMTHMHLMMLLRREGSATVSDIARRFQIAKPNITPLIDRLAQEGLVERVRGDKDKRVIYIRLRSEGEKRLDEICGIASENLMSLSDRLSGEDYAELRQACAKLTDIVCRATAEEKK